VTSGPGGEVAPLGPARGPPCRLAIGLGRAGLVPEQLQPVGAGWVAPAAPVALTVLSLAGPLGAGATAWSTKLMLALAHVLAAMIVIPMVTRRLSHVTRRR